MSIEFKTPRIRDEWTQLPSKNPLLLACLERLHDMCEASFGKGVVITCIYRTPEENAALYSAAGIAPPDSKPHTVWGAADIRSWMYSENELSEMLKFLNQPVFANANGKVTAFVHELPGGAAHFHIARN